VVVIDEAVCRIAGCAQIIVVAVHRAAGCRKCDRIIRYDISRTLKANSNPNTILVPSRTEVDGIVAYDGASIHIISIRRTLYCNRYSYSVVCIIIRSCFEYK